MSLNVSRPPELEDRERQCQATGLCSPDREAGRVREPDAVEIGRRFSEDMQHG